MNSVGVTHAACTALHVPRSRPGCLRGCSSPHASRTVACNAAGSGPLVKICGVTSVKDAELAAQSGADLIGMIMWQKAKRAVSEDTAKGIAAVAREYGIKAVGVFVDEDAASISSRCLSAGIQVAQLHGDGARAGLAGVDARLEVVYVLNCQPDGSPHTATPAALMQRLQVPAWRAPDWLLIDGMQGGSGQALDWQNLSVPASEATRGWLLAGGLTPDNVAQAAALARPAAVDVSSGVCGPDGLAKDAGRVRAFIEAAKSVKYA